MFNKEKETQKGVTRRGFVKGATIGVGALSLAGFGTKGAEGSKRSGPRQRWDKSVDVVVVGFGGAGAAAAIEASDAGAKVIVLEKAPGPGGSTALSEGIVYAAGTSVQKAAGAADSSDGMYKYYMAINNDWLDAELVRVLSNNSSDAVQWLINMGLEFPPDLLYYSGLEQQYTEVTPPVKRGHVVKGKGKALMDGLVRAVKDRKIDVFYETKGDSLIVNPKGQVTGINVKGKKGTLAIQAKGAVILASGGYARNRELLKNYFPLQLRAVPYTVPEVTGDGLLMAEKIGAPIVGTGCIELPPAVPALEVIPGEQAIIYTLVYYTTKHSAIFVNETGKRFCNELAYYQVVSPMILKQKAAFVIFDERTRRVFGGDPRFAFSPDLNQEIKDGTLKSAPTIADLAKVLGVDPHTLEETVSNFNKDVQNGTDPDFGRTKTLGPIDTPPFYGGKQTSVVIDTFGGLSINTRAQVLDPYRKPIPRLYAAGAVAETVRAYPGSGTYLIFCFVFGRIAGKNAAAEKPHGSLF